MDLSLSGGGGGGGGSSERRNPPWLRPCPLKNLNGLNGINIICCIHACILAPKGEEDRDAARLPLWLTYYTGSCIHVHSSLAAPHKKVH